MGREKSRPYSPKRFNCRDGILAVRQKKENRDLLNFAFLCALCAFVVKIIGNIQMTDFNAVILTFPRLPAHRNGKL